MRRDALLLKPNFRKSVAFFRNDASRLPKRHYVLLTENAINFEERCRTANQRNVHGQWMRKWARKVQAANARARDKHSKQSNNARLDSIVNDVEQPDGHGQVKPSRATRAGIEIEHTFLRVEIRHVRVAVEDGCEFCGCGIEVEGLEVVEHVEVKGGVRGILNEGDFGLGKPGAGTIMVDVAPNRGDGSDLCEFIEDRGFAHVAKVEDSVDSLQRGGDFGPEETVGIADDAEEHGFRISGARGIRLCGSSPGRQPVGRPAVL